jgi:hypothetical protein
MAPRPKHLCGCGCTLYVTRAIELGHLKGKRSAVLAANALSQNQSLLHSRKQASNSQLISSSRRSLKGAIIGHPAPVRQEFSSRKASRLDRLPSENPPSETGDEYTNFPASEAGPSGVSPLNIDLDMTLSRSPTPASEARPSGVSPHSINLDMSVSRSPTPASEAGPSGVSPHTIDLDKSLSTQCSPTPETRDLSPHSSAKLLLPDADGRDQHDSYGLSTQRRSQRITERVKQIGRVRWGTNHVQFIEREEREKREEDEEEDEEEVSIAENMEDEEEHGDDELEDEEDMPFAEPGQEGVSVWDLLGEGFLIEVADLGKFILSNPKCLSDVSLRRETS